MKLTSQILATHGNKIAGRIRAGIVIALKRNGAYAGDIQVQQLGYKPSCLKGD